MVGIAGCCAGAVSGHIVAPPTNVMKSRRLIVVAPEAKTAPIVSD